MLAALIFAASSQAAPLHHELIVELDLCCHAFSATDTISLGELEPAADGAYHFVLHAGLTPQLSTRSWRIKRESLEDAAPFVGINDAAEQAQVPLEAWRLVPGRRASDTVVLRYGGAIHHPLEAAGQEYQRGFSETPGLIGDDGVYLGGSSAWVPTFGHQLFTYALEVRDLDPAWDVVSQGERVLHALPEGRRELRWEQSAPTEEVHLVAGPFVTSSADAGGVTFHSFLREEDPGLVHRYQEATRRYLEMYRGILPDYPYASFALVENFWETGYGMPGFTLLGSQVIRFPWILTSSYPHELLHNWWGNSVYVDYEAGNWCEGLTAYMADHLLAEQKGEAVLHRRTTLKKYSDFVDAEQDFPLSDFGARHSAASEAVGYGKSLMLFHMLRRDLGDEAFLAALGQFYTDQKFKQASWAQLAAAFDAQRAGWGATMDLWTSRSGAPRLQIVTAQVHTTDAHPFSVELELAQAQSEDPFPLVVPVAITLEGHSEPAWHQLPCDERRCKAVLPCDARPLRLDVDPLFDLMRRLDPMEVPPALSTVQGASEVLYVLPSAAGEEELQAWRELAAGGGAPAAPRPARDDTIEALPAGAAWVLGWQNRFSGDLQRALGAQGVVADDERIQVGSERFPREDHSLVLVARAPEAADAAWGWVAAEPVAAIAGLGRKLPHYSRYGYLAFSGEEPSNVLKGLWEAKGSPLTRDLSDEALVPMGETQRSALAPLPPRFRAQALGAWVDKLADPALKGRGLASPGLLQASADVAREFERLGLEPAGDEGGFRQVFALGPSGQDSSAQPMPTGTNLLARIPGTDPALADEPVLVMAHIDHLGLGGPQGSAENMGKVHPGADDNASGVAVLLGLAGALAAEPQRARPVLFAVTSAEEVGLVGSRHLLASLDENKPSACLNMDTVGRLSSGRFYVLNADSAREWRFIFMGVGYTTGLDVAIVPEPLDSSDQVACLEVGVPGVQLFTGPHSDYHQPGDSADRVDDQGLAAVAEAAYQTVDYLAGRTEPMTVSLELVANAGGHPASAHPSGGHPGGGHPGMNGHPAGARKVSLGTMPDFAFAGPGVKVQEVRAGSPAAAAGILAGDVLLAVAGHEIEGLKGLSVALKSKAVGDQVSVRLRRGDEELEVTATLEER